MIAIPSVPRGTSKSRVVVAEALYLRASSRPGQRISWDAALIGRGNRARSSCSSKSSLVVIRRSNPEAARRHLHRYILRLGGGKLRTATELPERPQRQTAI